MDGNAPTLVAVVDALAEARAALFGGLLAAYYGKARATADVDVIVSRCAIGPLQAGLERRGYVVRRFPCLMKIYARGIPDSVGDFLMLESNPVLRAAFAATERGEIFGVGVSMLQRGAFVAMKYDSAVTPRRPAKNRALDVADIRGVLERSFGPNDERVAAELARTMRPNGVENLRSLLDDLRHGRWPRVVERAAIQGALLRGRAFASPLRGRVR
jgi:hypothetical protein